MLASSSFTVALTFPRVADLLLPFVRRGTEQKAMFCTDEMNSAHMRCSLPSQVGAMIIVYSTSKWNTPYAPL